MILLLSLEALVAPAQVAPATATSQAATPDEIVVTAKHDKCFMEYAKHQVSTHELSALSATWALGSPVRVIEPRGASIRCEFQIMTLLNKHGQHLAQFVPRVEDVSADPTQSAPAADTKPIVPPSPPSPPNTVLASDASRRPSLVVPRTVRTSSTMSAYASRSGIVTLTCLMADPDKPYPLNVEVNEANGTATPSRPDTGGGSQMKATFMPDSVRFGPFLIDRTTLHIQRTNGPSGDTTQAAAIVQGQCNVVQSFRRAF